MPIPLPMRKARTLEGIASAFAQAVAEGDLREAEGWLAVARLVERTEPDVVIPERRPRLLERAPGSRS